jgi:hypothetical protein
MTPAVDARVAGVISDYQGDTRIAALRELWPELADALDELVNMWHQAYPPPNVERNDPYSRAILALQEDVDTLAAERDELRRELARHLDQH